MKPVEFSVEAEAEFAVAAVRYERARPGYGVRFRNAVYAARETIGTHPAYGEEIPRTPCRQCPVSGFPYTIVYTDGPQSIEIIAVAHQKRKPGYWKRRLRRS